MQRIDLWNLSDTEFNKWRRENDLKTLFEKFNTALPRFGEWLISNQLTIDFILKTDKPGSFFYWDKETLLIEFKESESNPYLFIPIQDKDHEKRLVSIEKDKDNTIEYRFKPYFLWAKDKLKSDKILQSRFGEFDTFRYILINAPDLPEHSHTFIAPGIQVLKLGGIKLNGWGVAKHRNLDFTDLDYLEIDGDFLQDSKLDIFYSSCRNIKLINAHVNFVNFYGCHFEKFVCANSRIYSSGFYQCDVFGAIFENSSLANFVITDCSSSGFTFNRVEVANFVYVPPKKEWHSGVAGTFETVTDNYKRFRVLYQNNGHRREAGKAYYNERYYALRYLVASIHLKRIIKDIRHYGLKHTMPNIFLTAKKTGPILSDSISMLVWGFGERPNRTIAFAVSILLLYTLIYYFSNVDTLGGSFTNSIYMSAIIFSTLGFGNYDPFLNGEFKLIIATEALIGAFTYGLFIAGYANKSKY